MRPLFFAGLLRLGILGVVLAITPTLTLPTPLLAQPLQAIPASESRLLRTLTVNGYGEERLPATQAQISLTIEGKGKEPLEVQQEVARKSETLLSYLRSQSAQRLTAPGVTLSPIYRTDNKGRQVEEGYSASNTVNFEVPIDRAGALLSAVVKGGATRVNSVGFSPSEDAIEAAKERTIAKASDQARRRTMAALQPLGLTIKEPLNVQIDGAIGSFPGGMADVSESLRLNLNTSFTGQDNLRARLKSQQFSTTTKLVGEAVFDVSQLAQGGVSPGEQLIQSSVTMILRY
jgi:uncharacterized protein